MTGLIWLDKQVAISRLEPNPLAYDRLAHLTLQTKCYQLHAVEAGQISWYVCLTLQTESNDKRFHQMHMPIMELFPDAHGYADTRTKDVEGD